MTLILESETDMAVVGGELIHGPIRVHVDAATVGATEYGRGVVMVRDGEAVRLAEMSEAGIWAMYASILVGVMTGLWLSKAWAMRMIVFLGLSLPLAADYQMHVRTQTVINPTAESQIKRVSIYPAVVDPGESRWEANAHSWHRYAPFQHSAYIRLLIRWDSGNYTWANNPIAVSKSSGDAWWEGIVPPVVLPESFNPSVHVARWVYYGSGSDWSIFLNNSAWASTGNHVSNGEGGYTVDVSTNEIVIGGGITRGALENHWEIEVAPHGVVQVHVERTYPFFLVIDDKRAYLDGDGNYSEEWIEESENTSTDTTIESPESEGSPNSYTQAAPPQYSSGEEPEPVERPDSEALGTNVGMNAAAEARHTEEKGLLGQIRDGTDMGVNVASAAAGQAARDAAGIKGSLDAIAAGDGEGVGEAGEGMGDVEGDVEAAVGEMREGVIDALAGLSDAIEDLAGSWGLGVSGAEYPVLTFTKPSMLGGGTLTMDFGVWDSVWQVMRGMILLVCAWGFLCATIDTVRGAFAG